MSKSDLTAGAPVVMLGNTTTATLSGLHQVEVAKQFCQRHDEPNDDDD